MYRIIIINNDTNFSRILKRHMENYSDEVKVEIFSKNIICSEYEYDAVFIGLDNDDDVKMKNEIIEYKKSNNGIPIIFITVDHELIMKERIKVIYSIALNTYLEENIGVILENLIMFLCIKNKQIKVNDEFDNSIVVFLNTNDIQSVVTQGNYVYIHTRERNFKKRITGYEMMKMLSSDFFESARGQIINLNKIKKIYKGKQMICMKNGDKINVSKKRMKELFEKINDKSSIC